MVKLKKALCMPMLISFVAAISATTVSAAKDGYGRFDSIDSTDSIRNSTDLIRNKKFDRFDKFDRCKCWDK